MKAGCYTQVLILGLFLGLLCSVTSSELSLNNRVLDSVPTHQYKYVKENRDADGTLHVFAVYKGFQTSFGSSEIVKNIEMIVSFHDKNTFRVKIKDALNQRWEIPEQAPFPHFQSDNKIPEGDSICEVHIEKDPFYVYITRKDTGATLFDTRNKDFLFSDLYIQLSSSLPSENIYGFGERNYKFKLSPGVYTIWGRDDPMIRQDGNAGGNTYSHHPVGLVRDKDGNFFLTLMRNSNAMDVILENDRANNDHSLTYKIVGGIIDLIFFVGTEYPEPLLKSYHNYLGNFTMMPFWSMGYHQSKWGYVNHATMNDVINKYTEHDLPLDVIWSDLDYMVNKEIFTLDTRNFPVEKMKEIQTKHKKKWVPIIDPGVRVDGPVGPGLREGLARNIFLKNKDGGNLRGYVWPGHVYYPDFFNPDAEKWWKDMLEIFYQTVPFAGIWLDMNEVANFVDGETPTRGPNRYDQLPYTPGAHPLHRKTISLDAKHRGGEMEFDVHTLFALLENVATYNFLQTKSKLPFILTRATSPGVGKVAAHWSGDNGAHWEFLQDSIPGNFNFQIYGIPFVGADICGFMDGTNAELCARWTQVGALYPFARNHHEERTRNQEPWTFNEMNSGVSVIETTRASLKTRYAILKWYYSLFIEKEGSGSIFRPLMFEFPHESELYNDGFGDQQFLLGRSVMCTPKVTPGEPHVEAYFPQATWYELFTGKRFISKDASDRTKRVNTPFNASVPMFLRGGHIVHAQAVERVLSTEDLNNEFELIVAVDRENENDMLSAKGTMMGLEKYDDDSVHDRCMQDNCLYDISVTVPREEVASVSVEISFKRQKQDINTRLDGFSLFGLKLYGLPLDFMAEDESKIGYGLLEITNENGEVFTNPDLVELLSIENNAFQIQFDTPLKIEDGTVLKLELLI